MQTRYWSQGKAVGYALDRSGGNAIIALRCFKLSGRYDPFYCLVLTLVLSMIVPAWSGGRSEQPVPTPVPIPATEEPEAPGGIDDSDEPVVMPVWDLLLHDEDRRVALREIADAVEMGYLPVGLHTTPERPGQLAVFIDDGWLPMAIAAVAIAVLTTCCASVTDAPTPLWRRRCF